MVGIVDGYTGKKHIYADLIGTHNRSLYGEGDYVLNVDENVGYNLVSNNEVDIKSGMFVIQGRRGYIKNGTTEVCRIDNGSQSLKRNDLIVIEYSKDQGNNVESFSVKVIKGTAGSTANDPNITTGDIKNGDTLHQMPLYRVRIEGLNIVAVEQMFKFGSVDAETVDPMNATKEGDAADAKKTRDAIEKLKNGLGTQATFSLSGTTLTITTK